MDIKQRLEKLIGPGIILKADTLHRVADVHYVWVKWYESLIDRLAENAKIVNGWPDGSSNWTEQNYTNDTHTALLLDIQLIKPKHPLAEKLRTICEGWMDTDKREALLEAAEELEKR